MKELVIAYLKYEFGYKELVIRRISDKRYTLRVNFTHLSSDKWESKDVSVWDMLAYLSEVKKNQRI